MKRIKVNGETRRLLSRWTLELANRLTAEYGMPRREAFERAHKTRKLLEALGVCLVEFCYRKSDGTVRTAHGTLCRGISPEFDSYEYKSPEPKEKDISAGTYTYWDLDKRGFRTFKAAELITFHELKRP